MSIKLFTATGCTRCKIVKRYMEEHGMDYTEYNMKAEGKEEFQKFYSANRKSVYRGADGIEFPIFFDGVEIHQGIGPAVSYLHSGNKLEGFVGMGNLHKEWVNGIHVSDGNPEYAAEFIDFLRYVKSNNLKVQLDTNGKNSQILEQILQEGLAAVAIMSVKGPKELYSQIVGEEIDKEDIEKSIALVAKFPEYRFETTVAPLIGQDGTVTYMTAQEVAGAAKMIEEVTGSKKNPYQINLFKPKEAKDERFKAIEPQPANALFSYRTAARAYQVLTEIEKA